MHFDIRAELRDPYHHDFRPSPGSQAAAHSALEPGLVVTSVGNTLVMGRPHEAVSRAIVAHPERPLTLLFSRVEGGHEPEPEPEPEVRAHAPRSVASQPACPRRARWSRSC